MENHDLNKNISENDKNSIDLNKMWKNSSITKTILNIERNYLEVLYRFTFIK